jgi:hypothetical protein
MGDLGVNAELKLRECDEAKAMEAACNTAWAMQLALRLVAQSAVL